MWLDNEKNFICVAKPKPIFQSGKNILDKKKPLLMDYVNPKKITYLPNTAGCFNSYDALRTLRLAREIGGWKLVKLEILGDKKTLYPEMIETLKSTEILGNERASLAVIKRILMEEESVQRPGKRNTIVDR